MAVALSCAGFASSHPRRPGPLGGSTVRQPPVAVGTIASAEWHARMRYSQEQRHRCTRACGCARPAGA